MPASTVNHDRYGLPLSTRSSKAAEQYMQGLELVLSGGLGAEDRFLQAVEHDEGFALAYAALATIDLRSRRPELARERIDRAKTFATSATRRERQHVEVLAEANFGDPKRGLDLSLEHLEDFPGDAYILQHYTFLRLGGGCHEMKAAILDTVERLAPAYGDDWFYTGTRSFYLHELNRFQESQRYAELSLAGNPLNGHAAHSLAHCFYETADYPGGIDFLDDWLDAYHPDAPHYPHLNWHLALFELVQGRYQRSVDIYRQSIRPMVLRQENATMGPPLADAASLLWRHMLYGVEENDYNDTWQEIEAFAVEVASGPVAPFNDAHCALTFAATGNQQAMTALIDKLRAAAEAGDVLTAEVGLPLVLGIEAFGRGAYEESIRFIEPLTGEIVRIAGSQAQRRVFEETLLRAYLLAGRLEDAERVLRRRLEHRHTGRDFYWLADTASARGDLDEARSNIAQARTLWTAADPNAPELLQTRTLNLRSR